MRATRITARENPCARARAENKLPSASARTNKYRARGIIALCNSRARSSTTGGCWLLQPRSVFFFVTPRDHSCRPCARFVYYDTTGTGAAAQAATTAAAVIGRVKRQDTRTRREATRAQFSALPYSSIYLSSSTCVFLGTGNVDARVYVDTYYAHRSRRLEWLVKHTRGEIPSRLTYTTRAAERVGLSSFSLSLFLASSHDRHTATDKGSTLCPCRGPSCPTKAFAARPRNAGCCLCCPRHLLFSTLRQRDRAAVGFFYTLRHRPPRAPSIATIRARHTILSPLSLAYALSRSLTRAHDRAIETLTRGASRD